MATPIRCARVRSRSSQSLSHWRLPGGDDFSLWKNVVRLRQNTFVTLRLILQVTYSRSMSKGLFNFLIICAWETKYSVLFHNFTTVCFPQCCLLERKLSIIFIVDHVFKSWHKSAYCLNLYVFKSSRCNRCLGAGPCSGKMLTAVCRRVGWVDANILAIASYRRCEWSWHVLGLHSDHDWGDWETLWGTLAGTHDRICIPAANVNTVQLAALYVLRSTKTTL